MSQTTPRGIVYPESTDDTRLWIHYQNLAESADAAIDAITRETFFSTSLDNPNGAVWASTVGTGSFMTFRKIGRFVTLRSTLVRPGSTPHSGSLITDIPVAFRPIEDVQFALGPGSSISGGFRMSLSPDGYVTWLKYTSENVSTHYWAFNTTYPVADY